MKKINVMLFFTALILLIASTTNAQTGDYPPNAEPGKCYAKCLIPDQYETVTEQVLIKEERTKLEVSTPNYEWVTETYEVKPATTRIEVVPESRETVTEQYEIEPATIRYEVVPAVYETITEQVESVPAGVRRKCTPMVYRTESESIEVAPATTKWVRRKADKNCLSADPNDCLVWCLVEVPARTEVINRKIPNCPTGAFMSGEECCTMEETSAQYTTVSKRVLKTPETVKEIPVPAKMGTITRKVIKEAPSYREVEIPAEYGTRKRKVLKNSGLTREVTIPAEYKTITKKVLVKPGGFTEWREILCPSGDGYVATIREIQNALRDRGYDPGPSDNILGQRSKAALVKFQKDNGLPIGQLDFETLRALGLNY